jgi:hypothetical protein
MHSIASNVWSSVEVRIESGEMTLVFMGGHTLRVMVPVLATVKG